MTKKQKYPTLTIRIEQDIKEYLEREKIKSEKSWSDYLKDISKFKK